MSNTTWPYKDKRGRVHLTIWQNRRQDATHYYSTEVYRRYNSAADDAEAEWKTTFKMDEQDLPNAIRLYDIADRVISDAKQRNTAQLREAA